jgi:hypothetical protein
MLWKQKTTALALLLTGGFFFLTPSFPPAVRHHWKITLPTAKPYTQPVGGFGEEFMTNVIV